MKKTFKAICTVLLICLCINVTAQTWPPAGMLGTGTQNDPWQITTAEHMSDLATFVNASSSNSGSTNGKYYKIMNDINLQYYSNWTPIGISSPDYYGGEIAFRGNFDGNGKIIQNLSISSTLNSRGLFGYVSGGIIQNLGLENCNINCSGSYVGGLVGGCNDITISNCHVTGTVIGGGGLVGAFDSRNSSSNVIISDCYVMGTVTGGGGLISYCGAFIGNNVITISNSYVSGNVTGRGGLLGSNSSSTTITISNCYVTGSVFRNGDNVGGLIGIASSTINILNCHTTCSVTGTGDAVGGLVGEVGGTLNITNCYTIGDVTGTSYVGGLVGRKVVTNNTQSVNISYCYATGTIKGTGTAIGGIIGNASRNVTISNCYTTCDVNGGNTVGGICGVLGGYDVSGNISYCHASGTIKGTNAYIGGIIGNSANNSNIIKNCVAANDSIISTGNITSINRIAGFHQAGNINTNSYTLNTTVLQNVNGNVTPHFQSISGTPKAIEELQSLTFYTTASNWNGGVWSIINSTDPWDICDGEGLPFLRWQEIECFFPVTNIINVPTAAVVGIPLTLTGTVVPSNAPYQTIVWSVYNAGTTGAIITGNTFNATNNGTATIKATIANGLGMGLEYTQNVPITVTKATLGGTVTITGTATFGQTLTANTGGLSSTPTVPLGTLSYQWKRNNTNISGATNSTYTLAQADVGTNITVTVSAENCNGEVTSSSTATVAKAPQTAPAAPTLASKTASSISLNTITGCEYRRGSNAWQTSTTFSGLTPNTSYSFQARKAETATHLASPESPSASFTTNRATLSGTVSITGSAIFEQTLTANTNNLSSTPSVSLGTLSYQWKRGTTNIGTNSATYTLVQADIGNTITVTVTAANCDGSRTSNPTATVTKATQTAPAAPTLASKTKTSITLNSIAGCEYNRDGGSWQTATTFSGLTPNTTYSFRARKAETATHLASPQSSVASFKTDEEVGIDENEQGKILVYPNPTTGKLSIVSEQFSVESVEIFDVYGRKLKGEGKKEKGEKEFLMDISDLATGVYFLRIMTEQGETVRKVVKE